MFWPLMDVGACLPNVGAAPLMDAACDLESVFLCFCFCVLLLLFSELVPVTIPLICYSEIYLWPFFQNLFKSFLSLAVLVP